MKTQRKRYCISSKSISCKIGLAIDMIDVNMPISLQKLADREDKQRVFINGHRGATNQLGYA